MRPLSFIVAAAAAAALDVRHSGSLPPGVHASQLHCSSIYNEEHPVKHRLPLPSAS